MTLVAKVRRTRGVLVQLRPRRTDDVGAEPRVQTAAERPKLRLLNFAGAVLVDAVEGSAQLRLFQVALLALFATRAAQWCMEK